jgi:hypothetical protein
VGALMVTFFAILAIAAGAIGITGILVTEHTERGVRWWANRPRFARPPKSQDRILATDQALAGPPIGPRPRQRIGATGPTGPALSTSQPDATMALARAINRLAEAVERQRRFP